MLVYVLVTIVAYLLGSISFSVIFGKKFAGVDVREKGSKNAGSTNVLRVAGKKAAICALICDILKGVVAVLIAFIVAKIIGQEGIDGALLIQLASFAVVIGHTFPIFFKFKGGKGVATALGVILVVNYQIGLICLVFALLIMALTRMVSVGSMGAALLFPVLTVFITQNYIIAPVSAANSYLPLAVAIAVLVLYNHRTNVKRLLGGTENKLSFKK